METGVDQDTWKITDEDDLKFVTEHGINKKNDFMLVAQDILNTYSQILIDIENKTIHSQKNIEDNINEYNFIKADLLECCKDKDNFKTKLEEKINEYILIVQNIINSY